MHIILFAFLQLCFAFPICVSNNYELWNWINFHFTSKWLWKRTVINIALLYPIFIILYGFEYSLHNSFHFDKLNIEIWREKSQSSQQIPRSFYTCSLHLKVMHSYYSLWKFFYAWEYMHICSLLFHHLPFTSAVWVMEMTTDVGSHMKVQYRNIFNLRNDLLSLTIKAVSFWLLCLHSFLALFHDRFFWVRKFDRRSLSSWTTKVHISASLPLLRFSFWVFFVFFFHENFF